ncbi:MFS transporter [Nocardia cyriacigeorgica]|uniref:MFS transporter n=1 Tax=Nocardia cyriacigeorgica TaxID=135487 RepID=UPI0013B83691|nr:MFS transporter [Nocardia cyriacigeorgica]NEW53022.1 MFS transporter [Nocardia cyriacigeorgica]
MSNIPITAAAPDTDPTRTGTGGLGAVWMLGLGTFAVGTDAFVVAGFLPDMAESLSVSTAKAGQSITVFAVAYALTAPVLATLTARIPRRALLVAALIVLGVANLGSALAPGFGFLLATRVLAAIGAAVYTPNAGAVSAALVRPDMRARALAIVVGGLTVATALGVPLGNVAVHWLNWRAALGIVAMLCLVVAAWLFRLIPALPGNPRVPLRTRLAVLTKPAVTAILPLTAIGMAAGYVAYAYTVPALASVGVAEHSVTVMLFLYGAGAVMGNLLSGYATDRWGPTRVLAIGYTTMAVALASLARIAATDVRLPLLVGLLVLLWGAGTWCQTPAQQHRLIAAAPGEAPLVVSLNASAIYAGIGFGTVVGGAAVGAHEGTIFGLGASIAVVALIFVVVSSVYAPRRTLDAESATQAV